MRYRNLICRTPKRALCKVLAIGICGTDKHTYSGETVQYKGTPDEFSIPFPIIQGHELAMEIVSIDEEGVEKSLL